MTSEDLSKTAAFRMHERGACECDLLYDISPLIMDIQLEKKMENDMETGII